MAIGQWTAWNQLYEHQWCYKQIGAELAPRVYAVQNLSEGLH